MAKVKEMKKENQKSIVTWSNDAKVELNGQEYQLVVQMRDLLNMICAKVNDRMIKSGKAEYISESDWKNKLKKAAEVEKEQIVQETLVEATVPTELAIAEGAIEPTTAIL